MNSDTFGSTVYNSSFPTRRGYFATQSGITSASTSNGVFQVNTDSGVNSQLFASVPSQTAVIGSNTGIDINANPAVLNGNLGRPGAAYRGERPYFSSTSFDGHPFLLQVEGQYTIATASTSAAPTITIYQCTAAAQATAIAAGLSGNAALVTASHSLVAVAGTTVSTAGTYGFLAQATLFWNSGSQLLSGEPWGIHAGPAGTTYSSRAAITGVSVTAYTDLNFFAVLSYTGATSVVSLTPTEFSLSAI